MNLNIFPLMGTFLLLLGCFKPQGLRDVNFDGYSNFQECWHTPGGSRDEFTAKLDVYQLDESTRVVDPISERCRLIDPVFNDISRKFSVKFTSFEVSDPMILKLTGRHIRNNTFSDFNAKFTGSIRVEGRARWRKGPQEYGLIIIPQELRGVQ